MLCSQVKHAGQNLTYSFLMLVLGGETTVTLRVAMIGVHDDVMIVNEPATSL